MAKYSLFIHSTGTTSALWANVPPELYAGTTPLFPANLGYPPNPPVPRGVTLNADDDARHLLAQIPADATALKVFGHSYGGLVAMKLARLATVPVESLVLLEPVLFGALGAVLDRHPEAVPEVENFHASPIFLNDAAGGTAPWLELFIDYWNRPGSWARMPAELQAAQLALGWKMYQEVRSVSLDATPFAEWQLPMPLTLLYGEKTTASAKAMVAELAAVNPHARVVMLPGVNHMAVAVKPAVVWAALAAL
jgi:pimeloyl-ACP methyl ester carboxylesterase